MAWFRKLYECDQCGEAWKDEWSCLCNDRCPGCNAEIEPSDHEDISIVVQPSRSMTLPGRATISEFEDRAAEKFAVLRSSDQAEHEPDYQVIEVFDTRSEAEAFAETARS
jgi:hypothetical protein